jgi:hypothetical protein
MRAQSIILVVAAVLLGIAVLGLIDPSSLRGSDCAPRQQGQQQRAVTPGTEAKRDFMFQINGFEAEGQRLNMYFHYRYDQGITTNDIPDFRDLRTDAINYMNNNASEGVYWETLSKGVCSKLKAKYPIEAISCQLQIYPGRDPGFSSSIHTIGDIEPLAIPGPVRASSSAGS